MADLYQRWLEEDLMQGIANSATCNVGVAFAIVVGSDMRRGWPQH